MQTVQKLNRLKPEIFVQVHSNCKWLLWIVQNSRARLVFFQGAFFSPTPTTFTKTDVPTQRSRSSSKSSPVECSYKTRNDAKCKVQIHGETPEEHVVLVSGLWQWNYYCAFCAPFLLISDLWMCGITPENRQRDAVKILAHRKIRFTTLSTAPLRVFHAPSNHGRRPSKSGRSDDAHRENLHKIALDIFSCSQRSSIRLTKGKARRQVCFKSVFLKIPASGGPRPMAWPTWNSQFLPAFPRILRTLWFLARLSPKLLTTFPRSLASCDTHKHRYISTPMNKDVYQRRWLSGGGRRFVA